MAMVVFAQRNTRRAGNQALVVSAVTAFALAAAAVPFATEAAPGPPVKEESGPVSPSAEAAADRPTPSKTPSSEAPSPSASPSASPSPLVVELVQLDPRGDDFHWAMAEPARFTKKQLAELDDAERGDEWVRGHSGVAVDSEQIKIVLRGAHPEPVTIIGMRARSTCREPLTGTLLTSPNAGDSPLSPIAFDLDRPNPEAASIAKDEFGNPVTDADWYVKMTGQYFRKRSITLDRGERAVFQVYAQTRRHYCEFTIEASTLVDGAVIRTRIDRKGEPFTVTASASPKDYSGYREVYFGGIASPKGWRLGRPTRSGDWLMPVTSRG
ncbi:hypothetical protein [Herbidospora galbida]|nr:hypothetical protein [Herbidospora galbida]